MLLIVSQTVSFLDERVYEHLINKHTSLLALLHTEECICIVWRHWNKVQQNSLPSTTIHPGFIRAGAMRLPIRFVKTNHELTLFPWKFPSSCIRALLCLDRSHPLMMSLTCGSPSGARAAQIHAQDERKKKKKRHSRPREILQFPSDDRRHLACNCGTAAIATSAGSVKPDN